MEFLRTAVRDASRIVIGIAHRSPPRGQNPENLPYWALYDNCRLFLSSELKRAWYPLRSFAYLTKSLAANRCGNHRKSRRNLSAVSPQCDGNADHVSASDSGQTMRRDSFPCAWARQWVLPPDVRSRKLIRAPESMLQFPTALGRVPDPVLR